MNKYELLYIIDNDLTSEQKQAVIDKISAIITSNEGSVDNIDTEKWGTRKLAYAINFKTEGYYVYVEFTAPAQVPALIERQIRILDETYRCMIIRK